MISMPPLSILAPIEQAAIAWRDMGLLLPPMPDAQALELDQHDETVFGTIAADPADRAAWQARARELASPASVLFGHVGYGANSYRLCYQLILGPVAIFLRQAFGGAYGDTAAEAARFNDAVERLEELIIHAEAAQAAGRIKQGQRLVIAVDEDGSSGWELVPGGAWHDNENPIDLVIKAFGPK